MTLLDSSKRRGLATAGVLALLTAAGGANAADLGGSLKDAPKAEEKRACQLSANVALTSQYVFRGFSQTAEGPAIQGGLDATCGRFYAGFWGSNLDFGGRAPVPGGFVGALQDVANIEIDWYGGIKHSFGRVDADLGVIYYSYPNAFDSRFPSTTGDVRTEQRELDYVEVKLGFTTKLTEQFTVTSTTFFSPEYTNRTGRVWTWEGGASYELPKMGGITPTLSALLGYQSGDSTRYRALIGNGDDNYLYWNAGVTFGFLEKFSLDLRYWDTSVDNNAATKVIAPGLNAANNFCDGKVTGIFQCDSRFVATLKATW